MCLRPCALLIRCPLFSNGLRITGVQLANLRSRPTCCPTCWEVGHDSSNVHKMMHGQGRKWVERQSSKWVQRKAAQAASRSIEEHRGGSAEAARYLP
jgi:hypothetical protein